MQINLISNAIKFTENGQVLLEINGRDSVNIIVSDSGIGIPADKQTIIFDNFLQLENPYIKLHSGMGLGLSIVKHLVHLMSGQIVLVSEPGKGSKFSITLPLLNKAEENNEISIANEGEVVAELEGLNILVAEDEAINRLYLCSLLKKQKWNVDEAADGYEVLGKIHDNVYDLILMDIGMPLMSGLEVIEEIRKGEQGHGRHIPIIALTAHAFPEDSDKCFKAGVDGFLTKPYQNNVLLQKIKDVLHKINV